MAMTVMPVRAEDEVKLAVVVPEQEIPPEVKPVRPKGYFRQSLKFGRTRVGLVLVVFVALVAIFGGFLAPHNTTQFVGNDFAPPSRVALFGTDYLGRDVFSRFLNGGHFILIMSALSAILGTGLGTIIGLLAGYSMKRADAVLMRIVDLVMAFPSLVLALLLIAVLGAHDWLIVSVVALGFLPHTARVVRASTIQTRESDFIRYAEATGISTWKILTREILPNIAAPITVEFGIRCTSAIGFIAGLDFLGLGVGPPAADWGLMIQENASGFLDNPWSIMLPVIFIALLCIGTNLMADGLLRAITGAGRTIETK